MTSAHFIFIPAVLGVGFLLGFLFSRKAAQDQVNRALKREKEREEARRKRAERKKQQSGAAGETLPDKPEAKKSKSKSKSKSAG